MHINLLISYDKMSNQKKEELSMGNYVSSSAIVLVLFILLVIILGAWI